MTTRKLMKMYSRNFLLQLQFLNKNKTRYCYHCAKFISSQAKEPPFINESPWSLYLQKVSSGVLSKDQHQELVVQHLQEIFQEVSVFRRPVKTPKIGESFFSIFRKKEPQKVIAPKGLYIYGSVGGGKTMLMDLFYETVPVSILQFNV